MNSRRELETSIQKWCRENAANCIHEEKSPLGERYEIRWLDSKNAVVRFIDVYPRDANRVIVQKGIFEGPAPDANVPEDQREKGPLYSRTVEQVYEVLRELKPFTDSMRRASLVRTAV